MAPSLLSAEEVKGGKPERSIAVYTEYSGVVVPLGETVTMGLIVDNNGRKDETIDLDLAEVPPGWKATLKGAAYGITGIFVPAGKSRNLSLILEPSHVAGPGTYDFRINARSRDGAIETTHRLTVTVRERSVAAGSEIIVSTSYPVLTGETDSTFQFSLDILNKGDTDRTFNLMSTGPEKWRIDLKPAFETKYISSLRIKGGQSQAITVEVTPPKEAKPGQYPILVRITSGDRIVDAKLAVALKGVYEINVGTTTGLLTTETMAGKPTSFSIFVTNVGTAVNRNITIDAMKPENWKATVKPAKIDALDPGKMQVVDITITPPQGALLGDYGVGLLVNAEKAYKSLEMRVTVKAATTWGWIGIGIILFVIAGLAFLFIWLGRR